MTFIIPIAVILVGILAFFLLRNVFGGGGAKAEASTPNGTPAGTFVAGAETPDPGASPTGTGTRELPTESASDPSISVFSPPPNREFGQNDTINFDWVWPALPGPGRHFAVYVIDGEQEYQLGTRTEPVSGQSYRLPVAVTDIPVIGDLVWQLRLESIDGSEVMVSSDVIPLLIRPAEPTGTATATATVTPTATMPPTETVDCVIDAPPGWVYYTIREGDSLSNLAARANIMVETLLEVNCLADDLLSVGQQIWVPPAAVPRTPTPQPPAPPTNPPQPPAPTATSGGATPEPRPPTSTPESPTTVPPTDSPTEPPPSATAPPPPTTIPP